MLHRQVQGGNVKACVDCGRRSVRSRCPDCSQRHEANRGTRQQRGLDGEYDRLRPLVLGDATRCAVCGQPFTSDNPATLGHIIPRRRGGTNDRANLRAECRRCNYGHATE